jgi:hypothetical protein
MIVPQCSTQQITAGREVDDVCQTGIGEAQMGVAAVAAKSCDKASFRAAYCVLHLPYCGLCSKGLVLLQLRAQSTEQPVAMRRNSGIGRAAICGVLQIDAGQARPAEQRLVAESGSSSSK